jgi:16S rRNA processing protein RimM
MTPNWESMAVVGRIARAHGIKGQVIVNPETDFPEQRFRPGAELFISRNGAVDRWTVTSARFHRNRPVIGFRGIEDMNAASALAGVELRVPVEWLMPLPDGAFYHHDLVGCSVESADGAVIGVVRRVEGDAAGSRLVVEAGNGEVLIPLAQDICSPIDVSRKRIVVRPPGGLLELNANPAKAGRGAGSDADRHRHHLSGDGRTGAGRRHRRPRD